MKLSIVSFHELAMNRIKPDIVHNNLSKFMKLSLMTFLKHAMNLIDFTKFKKIITIHQTLHINYMI